MGDALPGKGMTEACGGWTTEGVPTAIWSGSTLNVTGGSSPAPVGNVGHCLVPTPAPRLGFGSLPFRAASTSSAHTFTCTPILRVSTGMVCTPRPLYFFPLPPPPLVVNEPARDRR